MNCRSEAVPSLHVLRPVLANNPAVDGTMLDVSAQHGVPVVLYEHHMLSVCCAVTVVTMAAADSMGLESDN